MGTARTSQGIRITWSTWHWQGKDVAGPGPAKVAAEVPAVDAQRPSAYPRRGQFRVCQLALIRMLLGAAFATAWA